MTALAPRSGQPLQRGYQLIEMVDHDVGPQRLDRPVGKAEADRDARQAGGAGRVGIDDRIADERRPPAARAGDRLVKRGRIGLAHRQRVAADERGETLFPAKRRDQFTRQRLQLVGADREPHAPTRQRVERGFERGKGVAAIGDMAFIIFEKERKAAIDQGFRRAAGGAQPAIQKRSHAMADHVAHRFLRNRRPPQRDERMIERAGQIGGGIDESAIEIEGNDLKGKIGHEPPVTRRIWNMQAEHGKAPGMTRPPFAAIILAAGQGTRMKSALHKVLHPIAGRPMLGHLLASVEALAPARSLVVVGAGREQVEAEVERSGVAVVTQAEQLGTGHAVRQAAAALAGFEGDILILYGDVPLVTPETMARMLARLHEPDAPAAVVLGFRPDDAAAYGRIVARDGVIDKMVEYKDASAGERAVALCNSGLMAVRAADLWPLLARVGNANAAGEYYLPDIVMLAAGEGRRSAVIEAEAWEVAGVNSRAELAGVEAVWQARRRARAMAEGATLVAPETVWFSHDTAIGRDVLIEPNVFFGPGVAVADGAVIHGFSHIEGASIGPGAEIGPFARLRPGAEIGEKAKIGNFVEVKKARLGKGAKANHLTYLGDADIGADANIGAGTITCNYDGFLKYRTNIGAGAFIGSNSALVAPVTIGEGAIVAAGSVVTRDVAPDALTIARGAQEVKPGWAASFRVVMADRKKKG